MSGSPQSQQRLTLSLLCVACGAFAMLQTLVTPVLPTIQRGLDTTPDTAAWILIAYLLSAAVATPVLGRTGDLIGKDRALRIALAALTIGCAAAAVVPHVELFLASRVLQGAGGAVFPLAFGIVRDQLPARRVGPAIGTLSGVLAFGGGLGLVLAGPLDALLGWRSLFWIPMIATAAALILSKRWIAPAPRQPGERMGGGTAVLLAVWLVALLLPISMGSRWGWTSVTVWTMLGFAAAAFATWVFVDLRSTSPVIDLHLMVRRPVWVGNLVAFLLGASMFGVLGFLPQFIQTPPTDQGYGFGASVTSAGLILLTMPAAQALGSVASGRLTDRVSLRNQLAAGSAFMAAATCAFALANDHVWQIIVAAGGYGWGLGFAYATVTNIVIQAVPSGDTGSVSGLNANMRTIGGAIGVAVVGSILSSSSQGGTPTESGYVAGLLVLAALGLGAATTTALLLPTRISPREPDATTVLSGDGTS